MKFTRRMYFDAVAPELIASTAAASAPPAFGFCLGNDFLSCKNRLSAACSFLEESFLMSGISRGVPSFDKKNLLLLKVISNSSGSDSAEM